MNEPDRKSADDLLASWQERLAAVTRNAGELSEAEFTRRIRNRLREGRYAGLTLDRAGAAFEALGSLMDDYLLLARAIEAAIEAGKAGFLASREAREDQVRAVLEGPSIVRPSVRVPLQERELLGAAQQHDCITPQALLAAMEAAFRAARDTLAEIDAAEQHGAQEIAELRRDHAALARRAEALQAPGDRPGLVGLQDGAADPLAARAGTASLRRSLQAWSLQLAELEQARAAALAGVARAHQGLAELARLNELHAGHLGTVRALLGDAAAASLRPAAAAAQELLEPWCAAIDRSLSGGDWRAVNVGLSRFAPALDDAIAAARRLVAAAEARGAEVDELQGRFRALKAKERALRARGGLPARCAELRARIEAALVPRPLDIDDLRAALRGYQELLAAGGR